MSMLRRIRSGRLLPMLWRRFSAGGNNVSRHFVAVIDGVVHDTYDSTRDETVVLLSRQTPDDYLEVNVELDDDFLTKAESKGTYDQIKQYKIY